jgi:predicted MFS family arabinose efflux permease
MTTTGLRFLGWRMVAVSFVCHFVAVGFFFYSYGVLFKPLAADLGASRFEVSLGMACANLASAAVAPFIGRFIDQGKLGRVIALGALALGLGFTLASRVTALWQLGVVLATLVAAGVVGIGNIPSSALVARWFVTHRGVAMAIAALGVSLSGLVMPPVATWLTATYGWRGALLCYGIVTVVVVAPLGAFVVIDWPSERGAHADGNEAPPSEPADRDWSTRAMLRDKVFWAMALSFGMAFCSLAGILTHLVPMLTDAGVPPFLAASMVSLVAATGMGGKLVFGFLADRMAPRTVLWATIVLQLTATLVLLNEPHSLIALAASATLFGVGMGGTVLLQSAMTASVFGGRAFARAAGLMRPITQPLNAAGVPLAGWLYDREGSYRHALAAFAACYVIAALFAWLLPGEAQRLTSSAPSAHDKRLTRW